MTYTRNGDAVTLEMRIEDYGQLLVMLGFALGGAMEDVAMLRSFLRFVNELNRTNPSFIPFELPDAPAVEVAH